MNHKCTVSPASNPYVVRQPTLSRDTTLDKSPSPGADDHSPFPPATKKIDIMLLLFLPLYMPRPGSLCHIPSPLQLGYVTSSPDPPSRYVIIITLFFFYRHGLPSSSDYLEMSTPQNLLYGKACTLLACLPYPRRHREKLHPPQPPPLQVLHT